MAELTDLETASEDRQSPVLPLNYNSKIGSGCGNCIHYLDVMSVMSYFCSIPQKNHSVFSASVQFWIEICITPSLFSDTKSIPLIIIRAEPTFSKLSKTYRTLKQKNPQFFNYGVSFFFSQSIRQNGSRGLPRKRASYPNLCGFVLRISLKAFLLTFLIFYSDIQYSFFFLSPILYIFLGKSRKIFDYFRTPCIRLFPTCTFSDFFQHETHPLISKRSVLPFLLGLHFFSKAMDHKRNGFQITILYIYRY